MCIVCICALAFCEILDYSTIGDYSRQARCGRTTNTVVRYAKLNDGCNVFIPALEISSFLLCFFFIFSQVMHKLYPE